jgi:Zn-dependent protease/CBS domain-containing protein
LFLSIFGHELAHALMARAEGIKTLEIVLHPFGGLARLERAPDTARAEFRIAIAGPVASFLFAVIAFVVREGTFFAGYRTGTGIFFIIAWWNFLLAFFNLLPGYPLDGGRVLRAILWHRTGNLEEATRITSLGGQVIGWTLIVIGAYITLAWSDLLLGVWTIVVGLFLREAAASVLMEVGGARGSGGRTMRNMGSRTTGEAMMSPVSIEPEMLVSQFVDNVLPIHRRPAMLVARDGRLHGILALEDLKRLPRERWTRTHVRDVMRVVDADLFVDSRMSLAEAEEIMRRNGAGALGVVNHAGELVGFLQRNQKKEQASAPIRAHA